MVENRQQQNLISLNVYCHANFGCSSNPTKNLYIISSDDDVVGFLYYYLFYYHFQSQGLIRNCHFDLNFVFHKPSEINAIVSKSIFQMQWNSKRRDARETTCHFGKKPETLYF